jgi:hypothetical protein
VFAHNHHISDEYSSVEAMQIGEKNNVWLLILACATLSVERA